ncbi:MAG: nucleotide exchange factor GrpE [Rhodospirillaceae bacterium]|nr:nucleotide exchange factor GrpE [Rhodospirillaceae bacterium]
MSDQEKNSETPEEKTAATDVAADVEEQASEDEVGEELKADVEVKVDTMADPESEIAELKDKLLRNLAEMENLRRRSQKDREEALKYASANFARDMLTVADNLRRAIESIPEEGDPDGAALLGFIEGIALTEKELLSALERHKIQRIEPMGEKFNPQFHEALFEIPTNDAPHGTVMQVIETGYIIHDRLLRPAKVGIAKALPEDTGTRDEIDTTV